MLTDQRHEKIKKVVAMRQSGFIVVLEDIHDPHNAAAILRTCDGFGIQTVYFVFNKVEPYDPKKVGKVSSSTANKWLTYKIFSSSADCLQALKKENYSNVMTALNEKAESIYEFKWPDRIALWLGNEHEGLSEAINQADHVLQLPMKGMVQSLNVSVTAGICLYAATNFRELNGMEYTLDEASQQELIADFVRR